MTRPQTSVPTMSSFLCSLRWARTAFPGRDTPEYPDSAVSGQSPCRTLDPGVLGELFGLQCPDVDMVRGVVQVRHSLIEASGRLELASSTRLRTSAGATSAHCPKTRAALPAVGRSAESGHISPHQLQIVTTRRQCGDEFWQLDENGSVARSRGAAVKHVLEPKHHGAV
jgi:hypothetical protein